MLITNTNYKVQYTSDVHNKQVTQYEEKGTIIGKSTEYLRTTSLCQLIFALSGILMYGYNVGSKWQ